VAIDRWGRDLARDEGKQRYAAFEKALLQAAEDVLEHYTVDAKEFENSDIRKFDEVAIDLEGLVEYGDQMTTLIESKYGINRNTSGKISEKIEDSRNNER
jgi:hypothetical protein